ncbi:hypothetical protein C8R44DRAFT_883894 [Mycena epipterygia]|nr:hypothetical protein C8R44DRAFT_883894 [Mycena epipterygia]
MESDCVSFQASMLSSDVSDSSLLSTPELTPPSSCASSTDGSENSFFSALSSNNSDSLHPPVGVTKPQESIIDSPISEMGFPTRVEFPLKITTLDGRKSSYIPLHGSSVPSSPTSRRPRKLRKSRPSVPKLSLDSIISSSSPSPSSPTPLSLHQRPLLTSPIITCRPSTPERKFLKRNRRSSLPTIPSATFFTANKWNSGELDDEADQNSRAVRFVTPLGTTVSAPKYLGSKRKHTCFGFFSVDRPDPLVNRVVPLRFVERRDKFCFADASQ